MVWKQKEKNGVNILALGLGGWGNVMSWDIYSRVSFRIFGSAGSPHANLYPLMFFSPLLQK